LYALKPSRSKNSSARVLVGVDQGVLEVVHELPPVGEPAEPVGERLLVAAPQQQQVLAEGQAAARHRGEQAAGGQHAGERGQLGDPAVEQEAEREDGEGGRDQDRDTVAAHLAAAPGLPGGDAHGEHARGPEGVHERPVGVRPRVLDVAVDRVADGGEHEAEGEESPRASRAPARDA
jgi:hypothetical protein